MKTIFFALMLFLSAAQSSGQYADINKRHIMVHGGISLSRLQWIDYTHSSRFGQYIKGLAGRIDYRYINKKYFSLSSGIGLLHIGGGEKLWNDQKADIGVEYLAVNSIFRLKMPLGTVTPFLNIGLYAANDIKTNFRGYGEKSYWNFCTGTVAGLGISTLIHRREAGIEANMFPSFGKIGETSNYSTPYRSEIDNRTFTITAFIVFK